MAVFFWNPASGIQIHFGYFEVSYFYLNAMFQVKQAMQLIYGETIVVALLFIFLLPCFFGINGIWLSLPGTQIIMLLLFNVFFTKTGR